MAWTYEPGATRWKRFNGKGDVRAHRAPKGWVMYAEIMERHPVTGAPLKAPQWWIRETYIGEE